MAVNRLMGFHVVKSTRPTQFIHASFVPSRAYLAKRDPTHKDNKKFYPVPDYCLTAVQKYFFRIRE